ncbi:MAG: DUF2442 domain-containing protein [Chitinophagaceae bacterium]|jgi:hypothetical protein|nr:DUF2442 domain-containing protein [Chitinophagaceae bacterium]
MYIIKANYLHGYTIRLYFNDGLQKDVDFGTFLKKRSHPQWDKYNDPEIFKTFKIENGNIVWGKNWDLVFPLNKLRKGKII